MIEYNAKVNGVLIYHITCVNLGEKGITDKKGQNMYAYSYFSLKPNMLVVGVISHRPEDRAEGLCSLILKDIEKKKKKGEVKTND